MKKINSNPIFNVRISKEEKEEFKKYAEYEGKSLGTWVKHCVRDRIKEIKASNLPPPPSPPPVRVIDCSGGETKESKQLTKDWRDNK